MEKIDYSNIDEATARLEKIVDMGADESFSMFLSVEEQQRIQDIRIKRAAKTGEKVLEVRDDEYVIRGATLDDDGNVVDDFDISRFMREAEDEETGLLHDLKVDTRDLPKAKNFFDFCKRLMGPNTKHPYPLQAWVGAMLFGEVCPVCSDKDWLDIDNVPKDYPFLEMEDHLVLLERGVCPKCNRNKFDLIQNHGLKRYTQLVNCLGQRCVTGDTILLTGDGMQYIGDMAKSHGKGFTPFSSLLHNGKEMEQASDFYVAPRKEQVYEVTLSDGGVIKGTADHPLLTPRGFVRLENMKKGDSVSVAANTQVWGSNLSPARDMEIPADFNTIGIPSSVLCARKDQVVSYLVGLFGCVEYDGLANSKYVTKSSRLARELRAILLNLGFHPSIVKNGSEYIVSVGESGSTEGAEDRWVEVVSISISDEEHQTYDVTLPATHRFVGNGIVNHNSGKSLSAAMYSAYHLHRFLMFPSLASLTDSMQASTELTGTFVSLTYDKAKGVLWTPFMEIVNDSTFFTQYFECMDHYGEKYGRKLYNKASEFLRFNYRNIRFYPSGPKGSTLRGDCLTGDAMINTSAGFLHFEEMGIVPGFTETNDTYIDSPFGNKNVSHTYGKKDREVVQVRTRNGIELKGTPEHPLLVVQPDLSLQWVRLDKIKSGDFVVSRTKKTKPLFGNSPVTMDQATIMANGYRGEIASDDSIPLIVRTARKEVLHEFLESYFSCNSEARSKGGDSCVEIELSSASKKLTMQLQTILLQAYGIVGRLERRVEFKEKEYVTWILTLTGYDAWIFSQTFKRAKIQKHAERITYVDPGRGSDRRQVPYIKGLIKDFWKSLNAKAGQQYYTDAAGKRVKRPHRPKCFNHRPNENTAEFLIYEDSSMRHAAEFIEKMDPELGGRLLDLLELEAHFEEVVEVHSIHDTVDVYDVTVPDGHCFTANGLASHNTRCLGIVDELGLFRIPKDGQEEDGTSEIANADEAHKSLMRSLTTLDGAFIEAMKKGHYFAPSPILLNVSSPMSIRDKMMRLLKESRTEEGSKRILGIQKATWEFNPYLERDNPLIAGEFASNWEKAERDFGANPPLVHSRYMGVNSLREGIFVNGPNGHEFTYEREHFGELYGTIQKRRSFLYPSVVAIDAGCCVTGDTLIPTERGLLRIDQMGNHDGDRVSRNCGLRVGSRFSPEVAAQWHFMGEYPVRELVTDSGHNIRATYVHPQLIFRNGNHEWVKMGDLKVGDMVCINPVQISREDQLQINLVDNDVVPPANNTSGMKGVYYNKRDDKYSVILYFDGVRTHVGSYKKKDDAENACIRARERFCVANKATSTKSVKKPTHVTENLAYLMGSIISEGCISKYNTSFHNSDLSYIAKFEDAVLDVFGVSCTKSLSSKEGCKVVSPITRKVYYSNADVYGVYICSRTIASYFVQLGVKDSSEYGRKSAYHKEIPWSVLQADRKSQLAFIAAYIEGDGSIRRDRNEISIYSASETLIKQMQVLLSSHGVMTNISKNKELWTVTTACSVDAELLHSMVRPYMVHSKSDNSPKGRGVSNKYGFQIGWLKEFIKSRKIKSSNQGSHFFDDNGNVVVSNSVMSYIKSSSPNMTLLYEHFDSGVYDEFLSGLKLISESEHEKLINIFKLKYRYTPIVSLVDGKREPVYDLTMKDGVEPAFTANGMIIHNTDNSFCVVSAHYDFETGKTVVSNVIECMPNEGRRINFNLMYENVILPLCKATNAVYLTADQWQSLDILHRIRVDMGKLPDGKEVCTSRQVSPRRSNFDMLRALVVNRNIVLPTVKPERVEWIVNGGVDNYKAEMNEKPVEHLLLQMLTVREVAEGKPPTKGENFTDDIYRALVLATSAIHDPRIMERLTEARDSARRANQGSSVAPISVGRSQMLGLRRF
jgi:intein/homing endonuclease